MRRFWTRWTGSADESATVVLGVLAVLAGLSVVTQVIQVGGLMATGDLGTLPWWGVNAAFLALTLGLAAAVRRGYVTGAVLMMVSVLTALAAALITVDGPDNPMWVAVVVLGAAFAAVTLAARTVGWVIGGQAVAVMVPVLAFSTGVAEPLSPIEGSPTSAAGVVAVLLVGAAVAFVLRRGRPVPEPVAAPARVRTAGLTSRETEVAALVAAGQTNAQIGVALAMSPRTAQTHVANAMRKTGCQNRTELAVLAVAEGLRA